MKKTPLVAAILCLGMAMSASAESGDEVKQAIDDAKSAYAKANKIEGAWENTSKLIKKAEDAVAKGDKAAALKLAKKAKQEAELSYAQAVHQKDNWSPPPYAR